MRRKRIGLTLQKIQEYLKGQNYNYEIIVVDDGSKDNTWEVIRNVAQQNEAIYIIRNKKIKEKNTVLKKGCYTPMVNMFFSPMRIFLRL